MTNVAHAVQTKQRVSRSLSKKSFKSENHSQRQGEPEIPDPYFQIPSWAHDPGGRPSDSRRNGKKSGDKEYACRRGKQSRCDQSANLKAASFVERISWFQAEFHQVLAV